ncbi:TetR family transcriptional regulator [Amycolatopsis sp. NBRC 101858]|uniref:TetR/AcrR family transcriptional regulator n=1 Tax=Amycolatopsis sp. NBRC 101858 TaxID=3032200 RepID=UPI0024A009A7|nr:TetR/AcrR family transcriptional regulator [Amycolatopsis sp. NBRC 101858]GLY43179.1 TetR family transcriptional regulator [Amycolatopsis sp. NBRC 101858]
MSIGTTDGRELRAVRSRAALFAAAVELVSGRGSANVPVTDLAEAAGVSRQLVYLHFADRDALLVAAATDLARRELVLGEQSGRAAVLATARHFAAHRAFYRALLTGPCAFALTTALTELLAPGNRQVVRALFGDQVPAATADDLAVFLTGGAGALINAWLLGDEDPLDPEKLTNRLVRLMHTLGGLPEGDR